jgi:preprotein translocase SecE subunit
VATAKKPAKKPAKKQTLRERSEATQTAKPRRLRKTAGSIKKPLSVVGRLLKKLRIPLPDNKFGKVLRKIFHIIGLILWPKFFREAWGELRQVTWPGRRETWRLTTSVFIFAVVFAIIVGFLDFGLDKLFKELIVKK